ncbi:MAG: hypothetical protein OQK57_05075 [Ignavibacteriaceae bacterium]|nr:hypothetical protein [Ignavibacteriaceae bacterium]
MFIRNLVTSSFKQPLIKQLPSDASQTQIVYETFFNFSSLSQDFGYDYIYLFESRKLVNEY